MVGVATTQLLLASGCSTSREEALDAGAPAPRPDAAMGAPDVSGTDSGPRNVAPEGGPFVDDAAAGPADTAVTSDAGPDACSGPFSLENPLPASCLPYSNGIMAHKLPSDAMSHCWGDTADCAAGDAIAKCALTDCGGLSELSNPTYMGTFVWSSPGRDDFGEPLYYSAPTDPWYTIDAATPTGIQSFTFRAPSGALVSEGAEAEIAIWDQSTGLLFGAYTCCGPQTGTSIPVASGCGATQATACPLTGFTYKSVTTNVFGAPDWGNDPRPQTSNGTSPFAGTLRERELQAGVINHAIMLTVDCVNAAQPSVFPATANPGVCGTGGTFGPQDVRRPSAGTLIFCDYTPAQIAGFHLPAWQSTIVTALCTYGAYISETQVVSQHRGQPRRRREPRVEQKPGSITVSTSTPIRSGPGSPRNTLSTERSTSSTPGVQAARPAPTRAPTGASAHSSRTFRVRQARGALIAKATPVRQELAATRAGTCTSATSASRRDSPTSLAPAAERSVALGAGSRGAMFQSEVAFRRARIT